MSKYTDKFLDPKWQKRRLQILERDNWTCQSCHNTKATLNIHHLYYKKGKDPWEYPLSAFKTLCDNCHKVENKLMDKATTKLIQVMNLRGFLSDDVFDLAHAIDEMIYEKK